MRLWIHLTVTEHYLRRVPPFGYPRFNACLRLPVAFRSLPRPSSAISALASTLRSCSLDLPPLRALLRPLRRFADLVSACSLSLCSFQGALAPLPAFRLGKEAMLKVHRSSGEPSKRYSEGISETAFHRALFGVSPCRSALRLLFRRAFALRSTSGSARASRPRFSP